MDMVIQLVGSAGGAYLTYVILSRGVTAAMRDATGGRLYFGRLMLGLAVACTAITLLGFYGLLFSGDPEAAGPSLFLIAMFGTFSIYSWGELAGTRGEFDETGIRFRSPWGGARRYAWGQLRDITYNSSLHWSVLHFHGRGQIRASIYLHGIGELLELLERLTLAPEDN